MKILKKLRMKIPYIGRILKQNEDLRIKNSELEKISLQYFANKEIVKEDFKVYFLK